MPRGVKAGAKRGRYKRHSKPRLRQLARDVRAGKPDPEALAHAFESTGWLADRLIAESLRAGRQFEPTRLARAVEKLAAVHKPPPPRARLPLWMAKAALRHLAQEYGGKGEPIHKALRAEYPYAEDARVRRYYRQLARDHGSRDKAAIEDKIANIWPHKASRRHPILERAIKESQAGYGVPLAVWKSVSKKSGTK